MSSTFESKLNALYTAFLELNREHESMKADVDSLKAEKETILKILNKIVPKLPK
jgi:hypothetical protein